MNTAGWRVLRLATAAMALVTVVGCGGGDGTGDAGGLDAAAPGADAALAVDGGTPPRFDTGCASDSACADGVMCTRDTCTGGLCTNTPDSTLCAGSMTCDAVRGCVGSTACARSADCEDSDPCTTSERCDPATRTCMSMTLDGDGDGEPPPVCGGDDCDDSRPDVWSGGMERCDGADNDCNGTPDDGPASLLCADPLATCTRGSCECPTGYMECFGADGRECVDTRSDPMNCGLCNHECRDSTCEGGDCVCPAGQTDCGVFVSMCVDTMTSSSHCGACSRSCAGTCSGGTCTICGGRGQACCAGTTCTGSNVCRAGTCVACGGSGQPCCTSGTVCTASTTACGPAGTCTHCGAAGEPCCASGTPCTGAHTSCDATSVCAVDDCALPVARFPAADLPRCSAATATCIAGCTTSTCIGACIDADATPESPDGWDCRGCVNYAYLYCADSGGCHTQWANYNCCFAANCAGSTDPMCAVTYCPTQRSAYNTCASGLPDTCFYLDTGEPARCFP